MVTFLYFTKIKYTFKKVGFGNTDHMTLALFIVLQFS